eukprot:gnl/TRDRNA2_/TRDRNA2_89322_c0_seq1.p1 gnl/TRDRNA2_/TRDRNA2_89322_c0~~gnl/TRDRNA2_/TRDRNA2_89322_c0_seq1.p1  ORF type:complete len:548 (+),score=43.90 gnl/TRDRNA2_/TRDRNA2_89322_c0_seq1:82-1644(+)
MATLDQDTEECWRIRFRHFTLLQFAALLPELHRSLCEADICTLAKHYTQWFPSQFSLKFAAQFQEFCDRARTPSEYFKMRPVDALLDHGASSDFRTRLRRHLKLPLHVALCTHLATILLVVVGKEVPDVSKYVFWALLPCIICLLPTTGAAVLKSKRRAGGTLLGGVAALACLYCNPQNQPAFFMQCLIVAGVAKYSSMSSSIDYGGICFGLTWQFVVLSERDPDNANNDSTDTALVVALWRIGASLLGTSLATIGSLLLFPRHATVEFQKRTAEAVLCVTEVCVLATEDGVVEPGVGCEDTDGNFASKTTSDVLSSVVDLESFVRASAAHRLEVLAQGEAERRLVPRHVANLDALHQASKALAAAAVVVYSTVSRRTPHEQAAARAFMAEGAGVVLKRSILKTHEALRNAALALALQLRGVRAPHGKTSKNEVGKALRLMQRSLRRARKEAVESGAMASLVMQNIDRFYAQIDRLSKAGPWLHWLCRTLTGFMPKSTGCRSMPRSGLSFKLMCCIRIRA